MLELKNIVLTYPDGAERLTAIKNASMCIAQGEFAAITGPSGSGKSSLLAVAATLITPDSGTVLLDGVNATAANKKQAAKLRRTKLGIIFQSPNLLPALTAAEQLEMAARLNGSPRGRAARVALRERIMRLLAEVGMADHAKKRPGQLSGGQRQRINIARALVNEPRVLLVDEPTSALDTERSTAVMQLLAKLTHEHGLATAVVTHDAEQLRWCDSEHRMIDGRLSRVR